MIHAENERSTACTLRGDAYALTMLAWIQLKGKLAAVHVVVDFRGELGSGFSLRIDDNIPQSRLSVQIKGRDHADVASARTVEIGGLTREIIETA